MNKGNRFIKEKTSYLIYLAAFILSAIPALFLSAPFVEDSLGTMAMAAYLSGNDFSDFLIEKGFYYKYGQSLFYLPVFFCVHNPALRYKLLLVVNSVITAFIPVIIYKTGIKHLRMSQMDSAFTGLLSGCMPATLLYAKLTWAEPVLFTVPWIIIYIVLELFDVDSELKSLYNEEARADSYQGKLRLYRAYSLDDIRSKETLDIPVSVMLAHNDLVKRKSRLSILLAFTSTFAFMAHQRGIVVVIAVFMFLLLTRVVYKVHLVNPYGYGIGLVFMLVIDRILDGWLKGTVYRGAELKHNLLSAFLHPEIYQKLFSLRGLVVVARSVFGWLFNSSVSGMGFAILGMFLCIGCFWGLGKRKNYFSIKFKYMALLGSLFYVGAFLLGILFFFEGAYGYWDGSMVTRCDHLVFGRYLESSLPVMMYLGLYGITRLSQPGNVVDLREMGIKKTVFIAAMVQGVLLIYFTMRVAPVMDGVDSYVHSIMSMNICFDMSGVTLAQDHISNLPMALIIAGIVSLLVYVATCLLFKGNNKRLSYMIHGVLFCYIYLRSFADILYRVDTNAMTDFARYYLGR